MKSIKSFFHSLEDSLCSIALAAMVLLPLIEIAARRLIGQGIPGSIGYVQHLTLWVGFLGAALAAREGRHLSLSTAANLLKGRWRTIAGTLAAAAATTVSVYLAIASAQFVWVERSSQSVLGGGLPLWIVEAIMPIGFAIVGLRFLWQTPGGWPGRLISAIGPVLVGCLNYLPEAAHTAILWPSVILILAATSLGAPVFTLLGGAALILFFSENVPIAVIPVEASATALVIC